LFIGSPGLALYAEFAALFAALGWAASRLRMVENEANDVPPSQRAKKKWRVFAEDDLVDAVARTDMPMFHSAQVVRCSSIV
jgi:hypothetical protein